MAKYAKYLIFILIPVILFIFTRLERVDSKTIKSAGSAFSGTSEATQASNYQKIPEWYLQNRVQIHTRLFIKIINAPLFFGFPEKLAQYPGAGVLTRQIKNGDEKPWWPSAVGTQNEATLSQGNVAKKIIDQLHTLNMKSIVYYRHQEDKEQSDLHPDWISKDINDQPLNSERGIFLCINSPYRDVLIKRVKELGEMGADGFYFDEDHMPLKGCFCEYCQKQYREKYGRDIREDFRNKNLIPFYQFRNESIERLFVDVRKALEDSPNHPVMLVSGHSWPTLTSLHMSSGIFKNFILKSELSIPVKATMFKFNFPMQMDFETKISGFNINAFYFSFMRDNSYGPPHIWCPRLSAPEDINRVAAGLISLGCIANLDIDARTGDIESFKDAIYLNKKYGQYFKEMVPYSYAGILVSEQQRNHYLDHPDRAWGDVIIPAFTTFNYLNRAGIPIKLIADAGMDNANVEPLSKVFCNKRLTDVKPLDRAAADKFIDFSSLNKKKDVLSFAMASGSPIFCTKSDENYNVNYFKDRNGYLYIAAAPDFTSAIHENAKNLQISMQNLVQNQLADNTVSLKFYLNKNFIANTDLEDLTNDSRIKYDGEKNGYYTFNVTCNKEDLRLLRIKLSK